MTQSNTIANTILAQFGGMPFMKANRVSNITVIPEGGVEFDFEPHADWRGSKKNIDHIRVLLKGSKYTLQFITMSGMMHRVVHTERNVYPDELVPLFEIHVKGIK